MPKSIFTQDDWGGLVRSVTFHPATDLPALPVSAVHCIPFVSAGKLVLGHLPRGYDIPGGHVEAGEQVLAALSRELQEEVGAAIVGEPQLVGYYKVCNFATCLVQKACCETNTESGKCRACGYGYPLEAAMILYAARVDLKPWTPNHESTERICVSFEDLSQYHHDWKVQKAQIFSYVAQQFPHFFVD